MTRGGGAGPDRDKSVPNENQAGNAIGTGLTVAKIAAGQQRGPLWPAGKKVVAEGDGREKKAEPRAPLLGLIKKERPVDCARGDTTIVRRA